MNHENPEAWMRAAGGTTEVPVLREDPIQDGIGDGRVTSKEQPARLEIGSDVEIARRVTEDLSVKYGEVVYCEGAFWYFGGTHWMAIPDEALRLTIYRYDGAIYVTPEGKLQAAKLNRARIDSILACMQPALFHRDFFTTSVI